ncbi:MAG: DNA (cytosine-5-)-methyltransferase [Atribacterota bacterium]|nr:DNA (cytosine-5-)-methyltransferase [Atribacterota bacterium]
MNKEYTVGSMFAGIGGICLAFKNAGFKIKWANEIDKHACITYRLNFPDNNLFEEDVNNLHNIKETMGYVDVITSGFPCQAFSVAGYRNGFKDPRGNLFFETARFIDILRPKVFFLENVRNLKGHDNGKTFNIIEKTLSEDLGYSFIPFILNSKDYGNIPQTRERIYMVGFRNEKDITHILKGPGLFNSNTGNKATLTNTFDIPEKIPLTTTIADLLFEHKVDDKYYYKENHRYYSKLSETIKSEKTLYQWRRIYVRENKSNLCPTLTANMGTGGHNVPILKNGHGIRKLTPRECLRFQGFPDSFKIPDQLADSHIYKQAGNSVVVSVVERIAEKIKKSLDSSIQ